MTLEQAFEDWYDEISQDRRQQGRPPCGSLTGWMLEPATHELARRLESHRVSLDACAVITAGVMPLARQGWQQSSGAPTFEYAWGRAAIGRTQGIHINESRFQRYLKVGGFDDLLTAVQEGVRVLTTAKSPFSLASLAVSIAHYDRYQRTQDTERHATLERWPIAAAARFYSGQGQ